ncbi:MAG: recombinase [Lachnospiraceae bacterium]|nr:recombinase [Lachnospiraceae bacterium]
MMGKGSVNHNTRAFSAKNVDKERSRDNVEFCHSDIKEVYHTLFDEALERYNAKQKRSDRKISDYYEKIRRGKQEKLFYEVIFQIGNKDDMNVQSNEGQLAKEILSKFMEQFQKRNPNLFVFSSHLHMDEQTPHIHIDFVPFIRNSKRGLDTRVSLKGALSEQGFKGGARGMTEWNEWIEAEKQELSKVMGRHGVQWKQLGTHNKHLSVLDFEKQERQKEVAELEQTISGSKEELSDILHRQIEAGRETEQIRKEGEAIRQELNKMVQSKEVMERNIHTYDEDAKWQLAEQGALMSAKNYRDKKALPLVEKLKEVVKNLTIKCVQLTEQGRKLTAKVDGQQVQISRLTDKVMEQSNIIDRLQEKATDLGSLERHLGREQVQSIVERSKALEQAERAKKRPKHTFEMSR